MQKIKLNLSRIAKYENKEKTEEKKDIQPIIYDSTMETYRILRKRKMDPITHENVDEEIAFKFPYKWDPYTGERLGIDEDGPLYFDPDVLISYFYSKRLNKLWVEPKDEQDGYYEGYYDDGMGAGEEFYIPGRGYHPEWYLFRLPTIDCYLTKDNNKQLITFAPKLTNEEIEEIKKKAEQRSENYCRENYGKKKRPDIVKMKSLYDKAIANKLQADYIPVGIKLSELPKEKRDQLLNKINRESVNELKKMV